MFIIKTYIHKIKAYKKMFGLIVKTQSVFVVTFSNISEPQSLTRICLTNGKPDGTWTVMLYVSLGSPENYLVCMSDVLLRHPENDLGFMCDVLLGHPEN